MSYIGSGLSPKRQPKQQSRRDIGLMVLATAVLVSTLSGFRQPHTVETAVIPQACIEALELSQTMVDTAAEQTAIARDTTRQLQALLDELLESGWISVESVDGYTPVSVVLPSQLTVDDWRRSVQRCKGVAEGAAL